MPVGNERGAGHAHVAGREGVREKMQAEGGSREHGSRNRPRYVERRLVCREVRPQLVERSTVLGFERVPVGGGEVTDVAGRELEEPAVRDEDLKGPCGDGAGPE